MSASYLEDKLHKVESYFLFPDISQQAKIVFGTICLITYLFYEQPPITLDFTYIFKVVLKAEWGWGEEGKQSIRITSGINILKSHDRPGESEWVKRKSQLGKVPSVIPDLHPLKGTLQ